MAAWPTCSSWHDILKPYKFPKQDKILEFPILVKNISFQIWKLAA